VRARLLHRSAAACRARVRGSAGAHSFACLGCAQAPRTGALAARRCNAHAAAACNSHRRGCALDARLRRAPRLRAQLRGRLAARPRGGAPARRGSARSCVQLQRASAHGRAFLEPLPPQIIANEQGNRTTPSYVAFTDTDRCAPPRRAPACCVAARGVPRLTRRGARTPPLQPGGRRGQEPGCAEPQEHRVRRQAPHRPPLRRRRGAGGHAALALPGGGRARRQAQHGGAVQGRDQEVCAGGDFVHGAGQDEGGCRGVPGPRMQERCGDCARLLQRQPAAGNKGRGRHQRPQRAAHHQRAHRGGHRVRAGPQGDGRQARAQRAHLRPGRRHLRRVAAHHRGGHLRGQGYRGRHPPGRRGCVREACCGTGGNAPAACNAALRADAAHACSRRPGQPHGDALRAGTAAVTAPVRGAARVSSASR
jgi:hypothetical protein